MIQVSIARGLRKDSNGKQDPIDYLINFPGLWRLNAEERAGLTVSCRATDSIPKVESAGNVKRVGKKDVQVMHNGLIMSLGGYHGEWMARIIKELKGHHEPQEEVLFFEVLKRLDSTASMIELGSFWSYYSLWFNKTINSPLNICCEPDPNNMMVGKNNAELNKAKNIHFISSAAGDSDGEITEITMDSDNSETTQVPIRTVDSLCNEFNIKSLDVLHLDIQGFELSALRGARAVVEAGQVRFVFISTHHYYFSRQANTHQECLHWLRQHGAHIIASHTVAESFSGDGLIVASFDERDKDFTVDVPINHTDNGLFRSYEEDIALLADFSRKNTA